MDFISIFWELLLCIGIYMIIGLILVGILHIFVPDSLIQKHLSGRGVKPVLKATLYGMPLPICSCGMIPMATSLKKSGASNAAVTSFFITTPMTGLDSIIATYGVFGWPMAILRVLGSLISGIVAGVFVNLIKEEEKKKAAFSWSKKPITNSSTCADDNCHSCCDHNHGAKKNLPKWQKGLDYSLNEVFKDVALPILIGLVFSAILMMFIPEDFMRGLKGQLILSYALVIIVSLPVYVCSSSTIPLAFTMLFLGVSPGAVFVFLSLAPTTNIITASIYKKLLGFKALIIYITTIVLISMIFGLMIDFALPRGLFIPQKLVGDEGYNIVEKISAVVFLGLLLYYSFPISKILKNQIVKGH